VSTGYCARQHASRFWSHIYQRQHLLQSGLRPWSEAAVLARVRLQCLTHLLSAGAWPASSCMRVALEFFQENAPSLRSVSALVPGLRPTRAARAPVENEPKPISCTVPPFVTSPVIVAISASSVSPAERVGCARHIRKASSPSKPRDQWMRHRSQSRGIPYRLTGHGRQPGFGRDLEAPPMHMQNALQHLLRCRRIVDARGANTAGVAHLAVMRQLPSRRRATRRPRDISQKQHQ
jgi:hypothetical protein